MDLARGHVLVCGGTGCTSSNSQKIIEEFESNLASKGLQDEIKVIRTGCFGLCALGPIVVVYPEGAFYSMVKEEDVKEIVEEHSDADGNFYRESHRLLEKLINYIVIDE